ncbi:hypothetical protein CDAR_220331 [Caerostris darwini]|uniref:Uncharacterized protein n=1 Tax=Caerostris darwini TaxID=1538125 RepID=A0AAV4UFX5_9ARAC|nr:hypothetical protein CDAR_220331 [Caerostris darwini]
MRCIKHDSSRLRDLSSHRARNMAKNTSHPRGVFAHPTAATLAGFIMQLPRHQESGRRLLRILACHSLRERVAAQVCPGLLPGEVHGRKA